MKMNRICIVPVLLFIALAAVSHAAPMPEYKGYKLYRIIPTTEAQMKFLINMNDRIDSFGLTNEVEFWTEPSMESLSVKAPLLLMLSPGKQKGVLSALQEEQITVEVAIDDLQSAIADEVKMSAEDMKAEADGRMTWTAYHRYPTIEKYINDLARDYPHLVSIEVLGQSYEGRNLYLLKLGNPHPDGKKKNAVWVDSHIHAREWITSATTTYIFNRLVTEYTTNATCRRMLDEVDWYWIPVVNPDGVEYTHESVRLWRKTRRINPFNENIGVDPNRNYDHKWLLAGANQNAGSDLFAGQFAFSEIENLLLTDATLARKDQIKVALTVHSAAQMWLVPWGYAIEYPPDFQDLVQMGRRATNALTAQFGTRYQVDNSAVLLGATAGSTDDWAKAKAGIKYAYTVELRDRGQYGFVLPPNQIIPSGIETFEAFNVVAQMVVEEYGLSVN